MPPGPGAPVQAPPTRPLVNPMKGYDVSDIVRDALAVLALFWSLFLVWDLNGITAASWAPLVATLISLLSVAVTYLGRSQILPPGTVTPALIRLLAGIPYVLVVLVYIVLDAASAQATGGLSGLGMYSADLQGGIGIGLAIGLAGAVLAAQPRRSEVRALRDATKTVAAWRWAAMGVACVVAAAALASLVLTVVNIVRPMMQWDTGAMVAWSFSEFFAAAAIVAAVGLPLLGISRGHRRWRPVSIAVGAGTTIAMLLGMASGVFALLITVIGRVFGAAGSLMDFDLYSVHMPQYALVFAPVAAAVAACAALEDRTQTAPELPQWFAAVRASFLVVGLYGVISALSLVMGAVCFMIGDAPSSMVWRELALAVPLAAVGLTGYFMIRTPSQRGRQLALVIVAITIGIGVVLGILTLTHSLDMGALDLVMYFAVPGLIGWAMLAPAPVRAWVATFPRAASVAVPGGYMGMPGATPAYGAGPTPGYPVGPDPIAAEASNPATPAQRLAEIAQYYPAYRGLVAGNPACYPQLREWIASHTAAPAQPAAPVAQPVAEPAQPSVSVPAQAGPPATQPTVAEPSAPAAPTAESPQPAAPSPASWEPPTTLPEPEVQTPATASETATEVLPVAAPSELPEPGQASAQPDADPVAAEAADPATPAARLAEIVQIRPDLRPAVARHPGCYPGLAAWLAEFHDPEIDAALASRPAN